MYGLVSRALEDLVILKYGEDSWDSIKSKANVEIDAFINNEPYPDEVTYKLVAAASEVLKISAKEVLLQFGRHWILKTGIENYGSLLRAGGESLQQFLINLHRFHARVQLIFPDLEPPTFYCTDLRENSLRLHYITHRRNLTDFVEGLLEGLSILFNTPIRVNLVEAKSSGADHDVFEVQWATPPTVST